MILLLTACSTQQNKLSGKTETIEFYYIMWACECANWATLADIDKYDGDSRDELSEHCVFVEPASKSLTLPDTLGYSGDIIQFTGQYYIDKGYPNNYVRSEQQVDKARVFRYTSFKVIKSNHHDYIDEEKK